MSNTRLTLQDEVLDDATADVPVCRPCYISDEALDAPEHHATFCAICTVPPCGICRVSDGALDEPEQHAGYTMVCGVPCAVSDETLDTP